MASPESAENSARFERLQILAALKSGQAEAKGFNDAYFMDHESILEDEEVMKTVAKTYPHIIGYLSQLNKEEGFVRRWFSLIENPEERKRVYQQARQNNLRISIEGL